MPYERLPARLRQLIPDEKGQEIFRRTFNSQMESGRSESVSFATAWGKLKDAGYKRDPKSGVWSKATEKSRKDTLKDKVDEYNEKYGEKHGRVTVSMLEDVYDRGIGAYRTNPESVRPNVKSKEQWAFARVNSFLSAARGSKKINHDQDIHDKIKKSQPTVSDVHVPSADWERTRKEDTFKPPAGARAAARRALRWREKYPDEAKGGTRVGWERANQLANGENLSRETVARMASFFARHKGNEEVSTENKEKPWRDRGRLMHDAWGGDTGREWSQRIVDGFKKGIDLGPLTFKSGVSSNRVEHPRDVLSSTDNNLGPCLAVFSLKSDVTSVTKGAELLGAPFFCTNAGSDAESLLIIPLSKVSVPIEPSSNEMWNEIGGNIGGNEVVCLVRDGTPSSQVLNKIFGANSNNSVRQFTFSVCGHDDHGISAPNVISKLLQVFNVGGGNTKPVTATYTCDTSVGKNKASPISDFCGIPLEKIFIPYNRIGRTDTNAPRAVLAHDSLAFQDLRNSGCSHFEKSGDFDTSHTSKIEVNDFLFLIEGDIGHIGYNMQGGNPSQLQKRQIDDDQFTEQSEAVVRSMDLGLEGEIHVHQRDGQAVYMPGEDHEEYLERIREIAGIESEDEPVKEGLLERAISAIIGAVMPQADVNKSQEEATVLKVDDEQGLVYGWAYVSTEDGQLLVDSQGDSIEPIEMEKMATDFMLNSRDAKVMHKGDNVGTFVHSFPLTNDIMKAFDIYSDREGWLVAMKPDNPEVMKAYKSGEYSGFSIGGKAGDVEEYDAS